MKDLKTARVIAVHRERYEMLCDGEMVYGRLKNGVYYMTEERFPTVGDYVMISENELGDSIIVKTLERTSCFERREPGPMPKSQVVAANFNYVFIMSSLNQDFNLNRISRYLTMARQSGGEPVVILTKADLCEKREEMVDAARHAAQGTAVIALSSATGEGLDALKTYLKPGKTIVFLGMSGVGKSSLLNALAGQALMAVKDIREDDARGRHTTTHRQLITLPSGAMIIDTPGMRELGLWNADEGISASFSDVEEVILRCRFSDCGHEKEPGCAVRAALENGTLSKKQWEGYLKQKRETRLIADRAGYAHEKQHKHKAIAKHQKNLKKQGGKNTCIP